MDAQVTDVKACMFHGSYHPALGSTLEHGTRSEWFQFLIHLPSLMHLHGETISVKKICLLSKVEKRMRVRLYRNFARYSIRKVEGETAALLFLSLPRSIKLPLREGKQQTRLFFFTLRGKYLTLRLSLKGQASPNLTETPFRTHTSHAILGCVQLSSLLQ